MIHVAILLPQYLDMIMRGEKTAELRLTRNALPPFEKIRVGERIFFKRSSGEFRCTALAREIFFQQNMTPRDVETLKQKYNKEICGEENYWQRKRISRYCTLVRLSHVEPVLYGPEFPPSKGPAWFVFPDKADVYPQCTYCRETLRSLSVSLSAGNIRNNHVSVRDIVSLFPRNSLGGNTIKEAGKPVTLLLQNGLTMETDIVKKSYLLRTRRHWKEWFKENNAHAGDRVVFIPRGNYTFGVYLWHETDEMSRHK